MTWPDLWRKRTDSKVLKENPKAPAVDLKLENKAEEFALGNKGLKEAKKRGG